MIKNIDKIPIPYSFGSVTVRHKNANIKTVFGSLGFDDLLSTYIEKFTYREAYVPLGYEHRPDLIANLFLGDPNFWWLILLINNIDDPFEGLNSGDKILLPNNL